MESHICSFAQPILLQIGESFSTEQFHQRWCCLLSYKCPNQQQRPQLSSSDDTTFVGLQGFSIVLQKPNSAFEEIQLRNNSINDSTMIFLAKSLTNNNNLKELHVFDWDIAANGWAAFSSVLCNKSSILGTFFSNHTLEQLCPLSNEPVLPKDIRLLLQLNRARKKITKAHFSGGETDMQPLRARTWTSCLMPLHGWHKTGAMGLGYFFTLFDPCLHCFILVAMLNLRMVPELSDGSDSP